MSGRPRARRWLFRWFLLGTSLAAGFSATATLDPVWGSGPATNRVWQLPPAPRLTWVGSGENLVKNGDFETGDFTGWDRVSPSGKQITLASAGNRVFSGTRSVAFITSFPGPQSLSQLVTLPPGSTPVLSWADRVVLSGENYQPPDHSFRVEVQTPEGFPLETLHELRPGDPRILPWTQRSVDLSRYAGQTVRISSLSSASVAPARIGPRRSVPYSVPTIRIRTWPTGSPSGTGASVNVPYRPRWMCTTCPPA